MRNMTLLLEYSRFFFAFAFIRDLKDRCRSESLVVQAASQLQLLNLASVLDVSLVVIFQLLFAHGCPSLKEPLGESMVFPFDTLGLPLPRVKIKTLSVPHWTKGSLDIDRSVARGDAGPFPSGDLNQFVEKGLVAAVDLQVLLVHLKLFVLLYFLFLFPNLFLNLQAAHNCRPRTEKDAGGHGRDSNASSAATLDLLELFLVPFPFSVHVRGRMTYSSRCLSSTTLFSMYIAAPFMF